MNYDLIVSDFDGTLADLDRVVSEENKKAIADYIAAGGIFTIGSGRNFQSLCKLIAGMGLKNTPLNLICLDGAIIRSYPSGQLLKDRPIDNDELIAVASECEKANLYFHLYDADGLYIAEENDINKTYREFTGSDYTVVGKLTDFIRLSKKSFYKLLIVTDADKSNTLVNEFNIKFGKNSMFFTSNPIFIEMCSKQAGKGNALEYLANFYNIPLEKTIAIGDQCNDLQMIERAGLAVAVDNAVHELKAVADYIAPLCSQSAVANVIKRFCL